MRNSPPFTEEPLPFVLGATPIDCIVLPVRTRTSCNEGEFVTLAEINTGVPPVAPSSWMRRERSQLSRFSHLFVNLLRSPWPCLSAGCIEGDRSKDQRLERVRIDVVSLMDVYGTPHVPFEARVEELARVLQRSPLGEGQLHCRLVRFAGADDPVMRPYRSAPLPLLHDVRVCRFDELAHCAQCLPAPVPEPGNSFVNQPRRRQAFG